MNAPLRRVGVVVLVLFGLLFVNLNWVQGYLASSYRNNEHNGRVQLTEYQRQRGTIAVVNGRDQVPVAKSVETSDQLKYLRQYPVDPNAYASIVGYKPVNGVATGIERAEDDFLSGTSDALFSERLRAMFTGQKTTGGNVLLTIDQKVQEIAYNDLLHNGTDAKNGAVVALDPATGAILAMATTPSYDPNQIVTHSTTHTKRLVRSPQSSVVMTTETRISAPPIVGVPAFVRCDCGPSTRTDCPILYAVSLRIMIGPTTNESTRAVRHASTARSVM